MLIEQQIAGRRERARGSVERILAKPDGDLYGDYAVRSASKKTYRVAMRGPGLFDNYCSCPDFAVNTLGTCKHIEAILLRLHRRRGKALDRDQFRRTRASLSLHYGETLTVRLRLSSLPLAGAAGTGSGILRRYCLAESRPFPRFRKAHGRVPQGRRSSRCLQ
jgi:uncharacterized Zn finger protein